MKVLIIATVLVLGVKFGVDYLNSADFQVYANKSKAPWTCHYENFRGEMNIVMSHYSEANEFFARSMARCPEGSSIERASYGYAESREKMGDFKGAIVAYENFAEKFKSSSRNRTARRAAQILSAP